MKRIPLHRFHRFFMKIKLRNLISSIKSVSMWYFYSKTVYTCRQWEREKKKKEKCFVTGKILLSPLVTRKIRIDAERLASIVIQLSISRDAQFRGGLFYWGDWLPLRSSIALLLFFYYFSSSSSSSSFDIDREFRKTDRGDVFGLSMEHALHVTFHADIFGWWWRMDGERERERVPSLGILDRCSRK